MKYKNNISALSSRCFLLIDYNFIRGFQQKIFALSPSFNGPRKLSRRTELSDEDCAVKCILYNSPKENKQKRQKSIALHHTIKAMLDGKKNCAESLKASALAQEAIHAVIYMTEQAFLVATG